MRHYFTKCTVFFSQHHILTLVYDTSRVQTISFFQQPHISAVGEL